MLFRLSILVAVVAAACTPATVGDDGCGDGPACEPGYLCVNQRCSQLCNTTFDCTAADEVCSEGICERDPNAGCTSDGECTNPSPCEVTAGAVCRGGECVYTARPEGLGCDDSDLCTENDACDAHGDCVGTPKVCASPPENACSGDDSTYTAYPSIGTCDVLGECHYEPTVVACAGCTVNCLQSCAGIVCADQEGGCLTNGVCTGVGGANCDYTPAADGVRCDQPGSATGALDGVCAGGACVDCTMPSHCNDPPGQPECFAATCPNNTCDYAAQPTVVCAPAECIDGFVYSERVCGAAGDCPATSPPGTSCQGYACDTSTTCKTSCSSEADCAPGSTCLGGGNCQPPAELGVGCTENGGCVSGFCVDDVCCDRACDGTCERCDDTGGTAGTCHLAAASTDPDFECTSSPTNCITNNCSGTSAACGLKSSGSDCGDCRECNASGQCVTDDTEDHECPICQRCSGGACVNQSSSQDIKNECTPDSGCGSGDCDGYGACDYASNNTNCGICRRCNSSGSCVVNSSDHTDCSTCRKCSSGVCVAQSSSEDLKGECSADAGCGTGDCDGGGACDYAANNTDCGTCRRCNSVGDCLTNSTDHADCNTCMKCSSGSCVNQSASEDLKNDCNPDAGCGDGDCNGGGGCDYESATVRCAMCTNCDGAGLCNVARGDDANCGVSGVIDCDGLDSPSTCSDYNDIVSARCEGAGDCKDPNSTDCTSVSPYPSSTICRNNTGADNCDHDEYCNGTSTSCPANDFGFVADKLCSGGTSGTILQVATGRSNVTAADRTACRDHCDTIANVTCCMVLGIPAIPPYVPDPFVNCNPYTGATTLSDNTTTYDYWAALCQ